MAASLQQKTIKKIWKNLSNERGFENFQPHWNLVFTDGTEAKLKLSEPNFVKVSTFIEANGAYQFLIDSGTTDSGKTWLAVRDIVQEEKAQEKAPQVQKETHREPVDPTKGGVPGQPVITPPTVGMILNNSVALVCARIEAGKGNTDPASIKADIEYFNTYFLEMVQTGKITGVPF